MSNEQNGLPTSHNARVLECDVCQDVVVPSHNETYKKMNGTACTVCENGVLKAERTDIVRRKDVADLIQDKIDGLEERRERVYRAYERESDPINWDDWHAEEDKIDAKVEQLQELLDEVDN